MTALESQSLIDLARRLVACPHFRWLEGMRTTSGGVVTDAYMSRWVGNPDAIPDLAHPGTLGCLLGLVRQAWGCDVMSACDGYARLRWRCAMRGDGGLMQTIGIRVWWPTEAEALVAALEAAPRPTSN